MEVLCALYELAMRGSVREGILVGVVVKRAAESGHCADVIVVQSDFSRFPGAALSLTSSEVGTEHHLDTCDALERITEKTRRRACWRTKITSPSAAMSMLAISDV